MSTLRAGKWSFICTLVPKHTIFCMQQEGYQCDQVFPNTQTEGIGNNTVEWFLPELLFTLRAGEWCSFALLSVCKRSVINVTRFSQIYNLNEQEIKKINKSVAEKDL